MPHASRSAGERFSGIPEPLRALDILDSIGDAVSVFDRNWRFTYANAAAAAMARRAPEALMGGSFWEFFPEMRGTDAEAHLHRTMNEGVHTRFENYYHPFELWVEVDAYPTAAGVAMIVRDISLRKKSAAEKELLYTQLKLSEQRFRVALKNSPVVIFNQDTNLVYTWVYNPLGRYRDTEWEGLTDDHLGAAGEPLRQLKQSVIDTGVGVRRELALETDGGTQHWDFHLEPLRDASGNVAGLTGAATDITAQKRTAAQIERQQAQLRAVMDGMPGLVSFVDRDYRYRFVNAGYSAWMGLPVNEVEGRLLSEVLAPDVFADRLPLLNRALAGETVVFERRFEARGITRDIRATYAPQYVAGEVDGIVVLVQDVTEQKRAEEARFASESQFRRIVEIASEGIWIVDMAGLTTFVNGRMAEMLGREPGEILGRPFIEFIHQDDVERGKVGFAQRIEGDTRPREYRAVRRDGATVWLDFTASTVRDNKGNATGVLAMCTDVTERRLAREQLQEAQKLESLGILAGGIAHDFNNLLVGIMGNASLAQDMLSPSSSVTGVIQNVIAASERAAELTHQMLAYSGKGRFLVETLDLSKTVEEILPLIARPIPANVRVDLKQAERLPLIEVDKSQLQQVVMNLVINAGEACGTQAGAVSVCTFQAQVAAGDVPPVFGLPPVPAGVYVCLEVKDNGAGMTEEVKARIFDPFFTTKFTGRGLGLSAVLGIIRAHKGGLEVKTEPGAGTVFRVYFPAAAASGAAKVAIQPAEVNAAVESPRGTVLVVDDEPLVLSMAKPALERDGFTVLAANSGFEAVRIFAEEAAGITTVVLDLTMPGMDGEAALAEIRKIDPFARIVLSSGFDETEVAERFRDKGLAGFLQKPYTPARLLHAVRTAGAKSTSA